MAPSEDARQTPAWSYEDLALLLGMLVPAVLLASVCSRALNHWLPQKGLVAVLGQLLIYAFLLAGLGALLRVRYGLSFWQALGWRMPWPGMFGTLLGGPTLAIAVGLLGVALKAPAGGMELEQLTRDRISLVAIAIGATTFGPLVEELLFRGFMQPLLSRSLGLAGGIAAASLPFALLHGPQYHWSWQHLLLLAIASATFGLVRHRTGSTAASTLMHAAYNFTYLMALIQAGDKLNRT